MKILKKNQVIIYVIAIMIMIAGYLNYTSNTNEKSLETSMQMETSDDTLLANIGDATLVNSNDIIEKDNEMSEEKENSTEASENDEVGQNEVVETTAEATKDEYFIQSKLERETMYSQILETYEKILNSNNSLETQKQTATQEIEKINEIKNSIMICENLIKTKGFENIIIFVNGKSISVIVGSEEIAQEDVAKIQNIISREMNADIENIHISNK